MSQPTGIFQKDEPYILVNYAVEDASIVLPEFEWLTAQEFNLCALPISSSEGSLTSEQIALVSQAKLVLCFATNHTASSSLFKEINQLGKQSNAGSLTIVLEDLSNLSSQQAAGLEEIPPIHKYAMSDDEYREKLIMTLMNHASESRIQPISTPAMPVMADEGAPNLIQHGVVAAAILALGVLAYVFLSP